MLHGITGSSRDKYMIEMAGACKENGINCICFNHYAPPDEKGLRLMNMCEDKYLDEVI
jgi:predicted alpha/beta-fold hydrolase